MRSSLKRLARACKTHRRLAIDGPWRWKHGLGTDQHWANQQGLQARCVIYPEQLEALYDLMPARGADPMPIPQT